MNSVLTRTVSIGGALRAALLKHGRALLPTAAAIAAVCMFGCGDGGGAGPRPMAREYTVDVESEGEGASGSGSYEEGATVAISAGAAPDSTMQFKHWTSSAESGVVFADADSSTTTFKMPAKVVTVTAVFEARDAAAPKTYAAVVSSPGKGATGSGDYLAGATVSISAGAAPDSMVFKNWTTTAGSGVIFSNADSVKTSFIMPAKAVTVTAVFEWKSAAPPTTYAVTVSSAGTGFSGGGSYATGATVAISAGMPPAGKKFVKWTASSGSGVVFANADSAATTFIMPARAVTVTASFDSLVATPVKKYLAVVSSAGAGSSGGGEYAAGDTVTISAGTPPEGQKFKNWRPAGVTLAHADSATTTFVMPAKDVAVVAVFEQQQGGTVTPPTKYLVTVSSGGINHSGTGEYEAGDSVKIFAGAPPSGQQFKNWTAPTGSGVVFAKADSVATSFIMPARAVTVTANFEALVVKYTVTISGGGTGSSGGGSYAAGATVSINAGTAPTDKQFKEWTTSDGVIFANSSSSATTFTMPTKAVTVTAVFEAKETLYTVTISGGGAGSSGGGSYAAGATVSIDAGAAASGKRFKNWTAASGSGVEFANANSAATTFTMPAKAVTVTANFESVYTVTVTGGTGGGSYAANETVTITAGAPPEGKRFKNWTTTTTGVTIVSPNNATTTFTMPSKAVAVTANFEAIPPEQFAVTVSGGTSTAASYEEGATVTITATVPTGQQFKNWTTTSNGVTFLSATSATTTFAMPANAVTVKANFEPKTYLVTVNGGTGGGSYAAGTIINISAGTEEDKEFDVWTTTSEGVTFVNAKSATTTFTMPANAVAVTANFVAVSSSEFNDVRDGKRYKTTVIGGKRWMGENLNYSTATGSWCYADRPDSCAKYGRLYDWSTAMGGAESSDEIPSGVRGICPNGWHLPSRQEWSQMFSAIGGITTGGTKLKSTSGWNESGNGNDEFGFSGLPGGYSDGSGGDFARVGEQGAWWTATEANGPSAHFRSLFYNSDGIEESYYYKDFAFSVRCVAD